MKKYDPIHYFDQGGSTIGNMTEDAEGDYYYAEDVDKRIALLEAELLLAKSTPMQPLIKGRFKENKIVSYCLDNTADLNVIATMNFSVEDREQFAQLIGYSLGGYGDLSYVTDESYYRAENLFSDGDDK